MTLPTPPDMRVRDGNATNYAELSRLGARLPGKYDADYEPAESGSGDSGSDSVFAASGAGR
ncbi:hypothetical protein [uncultured Rubinisphaera sp.]|uniref:hypothetical protein n=1 Tax=uncultured Rubinisphaera sp. TaxID=1678686 RepID=UPI0030DB3685